jgi:hypothetical protein
MEGDRGMEEWHPQSLSPLLLDLTATHAGVGLDKGE